MKNTSIIDIEVPSLAEYDTGNATALAQAIKSIRDFDKIATWDRIAMVEVDKIHRAIEAIEARRREAGTAYRQAQSARLEKGFLARAFASKEEETRLSAEQDRLGGEVEQLEALARRLQTLVEFTPGSIDEVDRLREEIRQRKKELQLKKRMAGTEATQVRTEARRQTATTAPGKWGTYDRRQIRLDKESALRPLEAERTALERRIAMLDQLDTWLERFK